MKTVEWAVEYYRDVKKKEAKAPKREIDIAEKRMQDYLQRHGGAT
jgi:phage-related protein